MFRYGVRKSPVCLIALFLLVPLTLESPDVCAQQSSRQPPGPNSPVDLSGDWTDENNRTYNISQTDKEILVRTETGEEFKGPIEGDKIKLTHKLSKKTVGKGFPDWLEEKLIGQEVFIQGTVSADGETLDTVYIDYDVEADPESKTVTKRMERRTPLLLTLNPDKVLIKVIVLDDQTGYSNSGRPKHPYPFQPGGDPTDRRTLFVYGQKLPRDYKQPIRYQSADPALEYSTIALATDHNPVTDPLFETGWKEALKNLDAETAEIVRKMDAMLVRVDLRRGVLPGMKDFSVNDADGSWQLRFGDDRALISFARDVASEPVAPELIPLDRVELTDSVYLPEQVFLEVRTEVPFPIDEIPLKVKVNKRPVLWNGKPVIIAKHVKDEPTGEVIEVFHEDRPHDFIRKVMRIYRTMLIELVEEGRDNPPQAPETFYLKVKPNDIIRVALEDEFLLTATPPAAGAMVLRTPARSWTIARDQTGKETVKEEDALTWKEALTRAGRLRGYQITDWYDLSRKESTVISNIVISPILLKHPISAAAAKIAELMTKQSQIYPFYHWNQYFTKWQFRERTTVTVADHAALLMLRDEFVKTMEKAAANLEEQTRVSPKGEWVMLRGWREAHKPEAYSDESPWRHIEVSCPAGKASTGGCYLSQVLSDGYLEETFGADKKAALEWSLKATADGIAKYKQAIKETIAKAKNIPDGNVEDLVKLIGYGYEPLLPHILPRMMKLEEVAEDVDSPPRLLWVPDLNARYSLWSLHTVTDAIRAQEDIASWDLGLKIGVGSAVVAPFLLSLGVPAAYVGFGVTAVDLGFSLGYQIPEAIQQRDDIQFALGASVILGTDRLNEAALRKTEWFEIVLQNVPAAWGLTEAAVALIPQISRDVARVRTLLLLRKLEAGGADAFRKLNVVQKARVLTFLFEAKMLEEVGAEKALSKMHKRALAIAEKMEADAKAKAPTATAGPKAPEPVEAHGDMAKAKTATLKKEEPTPTPPEQRQGETIAAKNPRSELYPGKKLGEIEKLERLRAAKNLDPKQVPIPFETVDAEGKEITLLLGERRGQGAFSWVYELLNQEEKYKGCVVKLIWDSDSFFDKAAVVRNMEAAGRRLTDARIPHLKIVDAVAEAPNLETPYVIQKKLPDGAIEFGKMDRSVAIGRFRNKGLQRAVVKLFYDIKEAVTKEGDKLIFEDGRLVNLYFFKDAKDEWVAGILDVDRVIPFADRSGRMGSFIDWVESVVSRKSIKSLWSAPRLDFESELEKDALKFNWEEKTLWEKAKGVAARAFIVRKGYGERLGRLAKVGPYFPDAEFFMEKMFEHKGWIDFEFIRDANGNIIGGQYKALLIEPEIIEKNGFPLLRDPRRNMNVDLTRPHWEISPATAPVRKSEIGAPELYRAGLPWFEIAALHGVSTSAVESQFATGGF